jgi:hypothetical protein
MRFAALALMASFAGGCSLTPSGGECNNDSQCGDDVCARGGECVARSNVRSVMVKWTVNGAAAGTAACTEHPALYLQFDGADYGDTLRFAPVPCVEGSFYVDKLPRRYGQVELGIEGGTGAGDITPIDASTALAQLDLFH